jgi:Regulator of chromosome condensation (RCC1) repeat
MRATALLQAASTLSLAALLASACGDDGKSVGVVSPTLEFGLTDCGTTAVPRVLTLTNESGESFTYSTALALGADSPYTVTPATGAVLARSQVTLTVTSKAIPSVSAVTDNLYGDTLQVTTDSGDVKIYDVAISQTARGIRLESSTAAVNFASAVKFGTSADSAVTITNTGNVTAKVMTTSSLRPYEATPAGEQTIAPGASLASTVTFSPGHNTENLATLQVTATGGAMCSEPLELPLSGTGDATGLAAQAVPASNFARPRQTGGVNAVCVRMTNGLVACGGSNIAGMRGITEEYLSQIPLPQGGKGGPPVPNSGGGITTLDVVNVVQTKDGYLDEVVDLYSGTAFFCARRQNAELWCWGDYQGKGQRADITTRSHFYATKVASGIAAAAGGYLTRCQTTAANNTLSCSSQRVSTNTPVTTAGWTVGGATSIATNGGGAYAVVGGEVWTFGRNPSGERGDSVADQDPPSKIPGFTDATAVVAGGRGNNRSNRFACARKTDATAVCWGDNRHGQLGNMNTENQTAPVSVINSATNTPLAGVTALAAGMAHICALLGDATVACWGRGSEGQLANGVLDQNNPTATVIPNLASVATLDSHGTRGTCAVLANHSVRCWGELLGGRYQLPTPLFAFEP